MAEWWQEFFLSGSYTELEEIPPERTEAQADFVVRTLALAPGERLLDVACGIGRHSLALARRGLAVVGLDYTPAYLRSAAAKASDLPVHFVRGDMRALPFPGGRFDAAVNLFTSFGYLGSDEADAAALREIGRVLRPGGRFLLDTIHRDAVAHRFLRQDWDTLPGGGFLLRERAWNARTGRVDETWVFLRGSEARRFTSAVRLYTCPEIERMLGGAGLEVDDVWGDWEGGPLTLASSRLIVRATRRNGGAASRI